MDCMRSGCAGLAGGIRPLRSSVRLGGESDGRWRAASPRGDKALDDDGSFLARNKQRAQRRQSQDRCRRRERRAGNRCRLTDRTIPVVLAGRCLLGSRLASISLRNAAVLMGIGREGLRRKCPMQMGLRDHALHDERRQHDVGERAGDAHPAHRLSQPSDRPHPHGSEVTHVDSHRATSKWAKTRRSTAQLVVKHSFAERTRLVRTRR